jgi:hypothetical protein
LKEKLAKLNDELAATRKHLDVIYLDNNLKSKLNISFYFILGNISIARQRRSKICSH